MRQPFRVFDFTGDAVGAGSGGSGLQPVPDAGFDVDFTSSIVPLFGSGMLSFSRPATKTFVDFEGTTRTAAVNELILDGRWRTENLVASSENFGGAGWAPFVSGDGVNTVNSGALTCSSAASGIAFYSRSVPLETGKVYVVYINITAVSGIGASGYPFSVSGLTMTVLDFQSIYTTGWWSCRFTVSTSGTGTCRFGIITTATGGRSITMAAAAIFELPATGHKPPYLSKGVLSTPYHGYGVDGVKYYSSYPQKIGVAIGDSITVGISSTFAYSAQLTARDIQAVVTNKGVSGQELPVIAARFATDVLALSPHFVIIEGGINDIQLSLTDPTASMQTAVTAMCNAAKAAGIDIILVNLLPFKGSTNWTAERQTWHAAYNAWLLSFATANSYKHLDGFSLVVDGGVPDTYQSANQAGDWLHPSATGQRMLTGGLLPLLPAAQTVSVPSANARGVLLSGTDTMAWPLTSISDTEGTIVVEAMATDWASAAGQYVGDGTEAPARTATTNLGIQAFDGTNTASGPAGTPSGTMKCVVKWTGSTMQCFAAGLSGSAQIYDGSFNLASLLIGSGFAGNIRRVRIWPSALSDAQCAALSS